MGDANPLNAKPKDYYESAYAHYGIHEEMLKDTVRTGSYRRAIVENSELFKDKIVLDVGCGSGILSMFAAQAGAKHVYGIEMSEIVHLARKIIKANDFENTVTILQGKLEEIDLPVPQVDIIISEWMGYFLLYEGMLDTVLYARDKWLAPDGIVMPDKAILYLTAIEDEEYKNNKYDWWKNVYGFDMSCVREIALAEPLVDIADPNSTVMDSCPVLRLDIMKCSKEDVNFECDYKLNALKTDRVHALLGYFDIHFSFGVDPVVFSTGPMAPYTHWKQTVFYTDHVFPVYRGEVISGHIKVEQNTTNHRDLDIEISYEFDGKECVEALRNTQYYLMK